MTKERREGDSAASRRDFLTLASRYGFGAGLLTWVAMPGASWAQKAAAAEAGAAGEAAKKARAKHVLTLGIDGVLNKSPEGPVTNVSLWCVGNVEFKNAVEKHSNGDVYVDLHDGATLGSQTASLKKVQQGIIQSCTCSTQNAAELAPVWNVLDIPYAIGPVENYWKLVFSPEFDKSVRAKSAAQNLMCLFTLPTPRWLEMSKKVGHDIRKPQDVNGLKMRVTGSKLEQAAFKILPANPTPIAWAEVFTALKDGAVDGVHVSAMSVLDGGMGPVVGQLVDTDWMYNSDSTWLTARWLESLPPSSREAVMQAAYDAQVYIHDLFPKLIRDQAGMAPDSPKVGWRTFDTKFIRLTDAERNVWKDFLSVERNKDVLNPLIDRYGRKEYELVVRVANGASGATPRPWWKA
jgi:TRAP-type C4-dicarboxylate transport system substrate-binding protein